MTRHDQLHEQLKDGDLLFAPTSERSDFATLTDPLNQMSQRDLQSMSREIQEFYGHRSQVQETRITFKSPPDGYAATWNCSPIPGINRRGHFVRLTPVGVPGQEERQEQANPSEANEAVADASNPKMSNTSDPETATAAEGSAPRVAESYASSDSVLEAGQADTEHPSECCADSSAVSTDATRRGDSNWTDQFFKDVARQINGVSGLLPQSTVAAHAEVLEIVIQKARRSPEHFSLMLYQSLILTLLQAAEDDGRKEDLVRLEMVNCSLDRMCRDAFFASLDRSATGSAEGSEIRRPDSSFLTRLASYLF